MLKKLPILLGIYGDISQIYTEERKIVSSPTELKNHIEKWKAIWSLGKTQEEKELASGEYDPEVVFQCFSKLSPESHCGHQTPSCHAMHIMLPFLFIDAFRTSNHFGVPYNVAFFRVLEAKDAVTDDDRDMFY